MALKETKYDPLVCLHILGHVVDDGGTHKVTLGVLGHLVHHWIIESFEEHFSKWQLFSNVLNRGKKILWIQTNSRSSLTKLLAKRKLRGFSETYFMIVTKHATAASLQLSQPQSNSIKGSYFLILVVTGKSTKYRDILADISCRAGLVILNFYIMTNGGRSFS